MKHITGSKMMLLGIALISLGGYTMHFSDGTDLFSDIMLFISFAFPVTGVFLVIKGFVSNDKQQ